MRFRLILQTGLNFLKYAWSLHPSGVKLVQDSLTKVQDFDATEAHRLRASVKLAHRASTGCVSHPEEGELGAGASAGRCVREELPGNRWQTV